MNMLNWEEIVRPTLVVDENRVAENIERMAQRARQAGVRFRPHFKTHQSREIGAMFRQAGVSQITVSSLAMAQFFADQGWQDITVAFSFNPREINLARRLAGQIHLGLLVESPESARQLLALSPAPADVWIKVDTGAGRTGIDWHDSDRIAATARALADQPHLSLRGLLTHAGHTYKAAGAAAIAAVYTESWQRLAGLQTRLEQDFPGLEISVGDTPGCTLSPELGAVDEIRPGNFVFYDAQMLRLGVCRPDQVAAIVACPVVALHPEREEVVIYGGAVHLSKDTVSDATGNWYGYIVSLTEAGWSAPLSGCGVARLSQEHGILHMPAEQIKQLKPGDLIGVMPAHICLTVAALQRYVTLSGKVIHTCPPDLDQAK
jgi:D-serine deaminase-like pyridoxal phosphate-dependent protein